jgi:hypothetical protein
MAPRFKRNMYRTYGKDKGADALVCFVKWDGKLILKFRDQLFSQIQRTSEFFLDKSEGKPTPIDSCFQLFEKHNENRAKEFHKKKPPGIWARILNARKAREYFAEAKAIFELASFSISTSHDHPCIEIHSTLHSEEELSRLIDKTATELKIEMAENCKLPPMRHILYTNRTFEIEKT